MVLRAPLARLGLVLGFLASTLVPQATVHAYDLPTEKPIVREAPKPPPGPNALAGVAFAPPGFWQAAQKLNWDQGETIQQSTHVYPGDNIFAAPHCAIAYTFCKYGEKSWDYMREMQLRNDIEQGKLNLENAQNITPDDELFLRALIARISDLEKQLTIVLEGRPRPVEGDACLKAYRVCFWEDFTTPELR